jgi:serine/threonine protein kinase/tetratricopeptide (TPR) repeat protein
MSSALAPERWKQLRPLLDRALDLEPAQRRAFIDEISLESPELRDDLERLLARHAETTGLDAPAAQLVGGRLAHGTTLEAAPAARFIGQRLGPFELRRLIGTGGMGAVYEAERVDGGFRQTVAIKLIGGVHPGLHERFARERQILAELRHPNIAQLLDGGESADGMPYFALEYIEGRSLVDHVDACAADLDVRLGLLVRAAEALAYAHRRKVLHRDIKPGNILVTADGGVKLLDFGISKLLDDSGQPTLTRQLLGPMTPEYAAPEQFRGEPLGVATDIYQFGVLMFRVLAGRSPYRVDSADALAFAHAVCDEAPLSLDAVLRSETSQPAPAPSTTGRRRRSRRQRRLDLDRILRRCLEKSPERRYASMDALIADIEAVRADSAPAARRSFAQRRALLGVALAALLGAGAWLFWQVPPDRLPWADPWLSSPALGALGLDRSHLHTSRPESEALLRRALQAEANGDLPRALALLESVHDADPTTPVPAIMLGYWGAAQLGLETTLAWQKKASERLAPLDDPALDLLARFTAADMSGDMEGALRYASALLELKPRAWFLHLARGHLLNYRGLRTAALRELQQIDTDRLDHRKLVDAIADRASLGDLAGAQAMAARLQAPPDDPGLAMLQARLAYTGGDLAGARDLFRSAVERAQDAARFDIEARALLYVGVLEGALGRYDEAEGPLRAARQRLQTRRQHNYAIDALLALSQIAALRGDLVAARHELDEARRLRNADGGAGQDPMIDLYAVRLLRQTPQVDPGDDAGLAALLRARSALLGGDTDAARNASESARSEGIAEGPFREEYALLRRELGMSEPELGPIDPPFGPYSRFASRWALGQGASVVPPPGTAR